MATTTRVSARSSKTAPGRTLRPYRTPDLNAVQEWLADNEVLDPEGPEEMFEPISERGLFRRMKGWFGRPERG